MEIGRKSQKLLRGRSDLEAVERMKLRQPAEGWVCKGVRAVKLLQRIRSL